MRSLPLWESHGIGGDQHAQKAVSIVRVEVRLCLYPVGMRTVERARALAESHLAMALPERWLHVQAVAQLAGEVGAVLDVDQDVLVAAAWLHDIGYAPDLVETGFHPLDGARYLRQAGVGERVSALVGHHSCAIMEADERGLLAELSAEFEREESPTADALWYCDMTTGPSGESVHAPERLEEIRSRYGPDHVVRRSMDRAEAVVLGAVRRTEERLRTRRKALEDVRL